MVSESLVEASDAEAAIGARLRTRRRQLGLTQTQLADALGVSFKQVQKYERGANRVSASMLCRIAQMLELRPADLLPADGEPVANPDQLVFGDAPNGAAVLEAWGRLKPTQRAEIRDLILNLAQKNLDRR